MTKRHTEVNQGQAFRASHESFLLDEFTCLMRYGWIKPREVLTWLRENRPSALNRLINGHVAPDELIGDEDLVNAAKRVDQPFEQHHKTLSGIEF